MSAEFFYEYVPLADGTPNINGIVKTYQAGTTIAQVTYPTYADAIAGTNPNATTFTLAADGVVSFWMSGAYKIDVQNSLGVTLPGWPKDNINAVNAVSTNPTFGFLNQVINGDFSIWQRGTTQTASGYGSDDRWSNDATGSTQVVTRQSVAPGASSSQYYSRTVVTSVAGAGNFAAKTQRMENVSLLNGQTVTILFDAWSTGPKNIAVEMGQNFGTGGAPSAPVNAIGSQIVAITATRTRYAVTVNIPSITGKTLGTDINSSFTFVNFWMDAGATYNTRAASLGQQSGTFNFANVDVRVGVWPNTTSMEIRPIGVELDLCKRYLPSQNVAAGTVAFYSGQVFTANTGFIPIPFDVEARAAPTGITVMGAGGYTVNQAAGAGSIVAVAFNTGSTSGGGLAFSGAAGLVAGNATCLGITAGALLWTGCEL